ncbi:MAG: glycosyltransferase family 4 protein [Clostridia bacterium]|nr:glycosyltransferase family 4 protein [Clostridia bacterium]
MNVLFLSIYEIKDSNSKYIYADLIKEFSKHGHNVYAVSPSSNGKSESFVDQNGVHIIRVKSGTIQKTNKIKKALNLMLFDSRVISAVKKSAKGVKFDLIITMVANLSLYKTTKYFKKKHNAYVYMSIKDILPHNAVDMGMITKKGVYGLIYRYYRSQEIKYYKLVDKIGCMSEANCDFILNLNPYLNRDKVEVQYNSIEPIDFELTQEEKDEMRKKYDIPLDKTVFVYGGNLGKPQGVPFIIDCLKAQKNNEEVFFLIVGSGTEYGKLEEYCLESNSKNVKLMKALPREDYDKMIGACDVGLIFLDFSFTVPNFPSRLLSYMQAKLPVLACTDVNTDVGKFIVSKGFGWWCQSNDVVAFENCVNDVLNSDLKAMGIVANNCLLNEFSVKNGYDLIISGCKNDIKK